ncbi:type II and III secretion system protein family protein [Tundrisphaera lichenicola]|uniref:type II and III secretion system protein family protein n=1 Tax=Tundrisphaera lichenicola TaxID=2029860 RepID=UPI003EB6C6F6
MRSMPTFGGPHRGRLRSSAGLAAALGLSLVANSTAQEPADLPPPPTISGITPRLPMPPEADEFDTSNSIIDSMGKTRSFIEVKVGQGRFLSLRENLVVPGQPAPFLAVGDPSVTDFFQVGPRQIRLLGKKMGTTDLSITTGSGKTYDYEVQVVADLDTLRVQLRQAFPDASLELSQVRDKVVVEGQARDAAQVSRIIATISSYINSVQSVRVAGQVADVQNVAQIGNPNVPPPPQPADGGAPLPALPNGPISTAPGATGVAGGPSMASPGAIAANQIATGSAPVINLIRVPTSQQVLLKVRVAELNRTGFRQIGADFAAAIPGVNALFGSQIAGNALSTGLNIGSQGTFYGRFGSENNFIFVLDALRRNNLLKILAEPNLIALNGHQASFLAGGQFPVPVIQGASGVSGAGGISVQYKDFGVRLSFLPLIQDNETIRLTVDPEVSSIDFSIGTTLVPGGTPTPGLNTRNSHTTVELRQGETLAIAGLMQLSLEGQTQRLPGLGDLPYIGGFFSNTTSNRIEKELVVLVTPYIVEPMAPGQIPAMPGEEVLQPNDLEFFLLNRIEGRTGIDKRSTTSYDDPLHLIRHSLVEKKYLIGPSGYSK